MQALSMLLPSHVSVIPTTSKSFESIKSVIESALFLTDLGFMLHIERQVFPFVSLREFHILSSSHAWVLYLTLC